MRPDAERLHRRSIRLKAYDYAQPGAYFVTMVTAGRKCILGRILDGEIFASDIGDIVTSEWRNLPRRFRFLELGAFVAMPNHVHAILIIHPSVGATRPDPNAAFTGEMRFPLIRNDRDEGSPLPCGPRRGSLGAIIAQFKARVTKRIWKLPGMRGLSVWQRNYYEHIIRDEKDWDRIHTYIESNPFTWAEDEENPDICP